MSTPKMAGRAAEILTTKAALVKSAAPVGEEVLQKEEKNPQRNTPLKKPARSARRFIRMSAASRTAK